MRLDEKGCWKVGSKIIEQIYRSYLILLMIDGENS